VLEPKALDGTRPRSGAGIDPRLALAEWMGREENPFFARAAANRVWAELMGRGIVEPVDDFRASNPPSNEPLLDFLAGRFVESGYDLKALMRLILESNVYQLSSIPNQYNTADIRHYSRAYRRRLPAEVLLDAISEVTGTEETLQGLAAGARASESWNHKLSSEFMDAFGRPDASAECPCERDTETSVVQALHLMNSTRLQGKLSDKQGRVARLAASELAPAEVVAELYLAAYSRLPTPEELSIALEAFAEKDATRQTAVEDVMWALVNSAEFVFNH
jgi:hypothetical protein